MIGLKYIVEKNLHYKCIFIYYSSVMFILKLKIIARNKEYIFCGHGEVFLRYLP